ncbi:MAG: DNRLRE domain-containing protein [Deltaproteobacteria bacterium]|nr:DNRLRE domain-containing protein [Deltaproteobacteria bacterium]
MLTNRFTGFGFSLIAGSAAVLCLCLLSPGRALGQGTYTVVPGQRVERSLNVPCALDFDLTNKVPTDPNVEEHLTWAVTEGMDWQGGNPAVGTYTAAYRDYKLKVYSAAGYAGEQRIDVGWNPALVYNVRAEIKSDRAVYVVKQNGVVVDETSVSAAAPPRVTMGYGWPPSVRNGATGAILSNIKWEEGTEPQNPGFEAQADTFTEETAPGANHGGEASLQTGGNGRVIFMRFQVSGDSGAVSGAILNLEAVNSGGGGEIHFVPDNSWTETGITHENKPCLSPTVLSGLGRVEAGTVYSFDVTAAVPDNGAYSFAIRSSDPDGSAYHSRESGGGMHPTLVVARGTRPALTAPAACADVTPDAGVQDAGSQDDAGTGIDTGSGVDAGSAPDAGSGVDAADLTDAASVLDAGVTTDTGTAADTASIEDTGTAADAQIPSDGGKKGADAGEYDYGLGCGCSTLGI